MDTYIKQILSYLEYLTDTYHWQITIHDFHHINGRFISAFSPYHIHNNPFCIQLKNTREVWDACICRQPSLVHKLTKPIQFGMCHCGVEEFILPISYKEKKIGFISVSGYRTDTETALQKLTHVSEKFQLNFPHMKELYFDYLNPNVPSQSLVYTLMASALLTLSIIDWRTYEIPVQINLFLAALGILATILDVPHLVSHLIGAAAISVPLWLLYLLTKGAAIGGGDIKLMAACGLILGWQNIVLAFLLACILGSFIHLLRMKLTGAGKTLAMGPYLSAGIFVTALYGQTWIHQYLALLGM